jgi:sulfur carrier protein
MHIIVNGNPTEIPDGTDMAGLIDRLELTGQRLAVEVNEELIPRSQFARHGLSSGDRVEIIHAVGGG